MRILLALCFMAIVGCTTVPSADDGARTVSSALAYPEQTRLGARVFKDSREHGDLSGYRLVAAGIDGLVARLQMARSAERTLDLQYFIFRGDASGQLLLQELQRAADRGVRVRILVDDGDTVAGDERVLALAMHPNIEVRVFNPFQYRGHNAVRRGLEFLTHKSRLDYRMHNKLMVVDNSAALIGGRNIGNQYFQVSPDSQFADDDVLAVGPVAVQLSTHFDEFWNSDFAVPAQGLLPRRMSRAAAAAVDFGEVDLQTRIVSGQPYDARADDLHLTWAPAAVVSDTPDKRGIDRHEHPGRLMARDVAAALQTSRTELVMITPYFVPSGTELALLERLRADGTRVAILSNSLESISGLAAHSGYRKYRVRLLRSGVELHEIRARLSTTRGSGESRRVASYGNYSLHAKLYVIDRRQLFIGSMNYDQRSWHINTEIGLLIQSPELATAVAGRFEAMVSPRAAYDLSLDPRGRIIWRTEIDGQTLTSEREPARHWWQRETVWLLSLVSMNREL